MLKGWNNSKLIFINFHAKPSSLLPTDWKTFPNLYSLQFLQDLNTIPESLKITKDLFDHAPSVIKKEMWKK